MFRVSSLLNLRLIQKSHTTTKTSSHLDQVAYIRSFTSSCVLPIFFTIVHKYLNCATCGIFANPRTFISVYIHAPLSNTPATLPHCPGVPVRAAVIIRSSAWSNSQSSSLLPFSLTTSIATTVTPHLGTQCHNAFYYFLLILSSVEDLYCNLNCFNRPSSFHVFKFLTVFVYHIFQSSTHYPARHFQHMFDKCNSSVASTLF